jgi:four helix bundle protein
MKYTRFEELPVWNDAIDLARRVYGFTAGEALRRHPGLRDQLERAALSVSNNIAEGFERGSTKELLAFLYIARGSAGEVRSMLYVLEGLSAFENLKSQIANLKGRCEGISKQLYGWIEKLKNSEITGQRHWDDRSRTRVAVQKDRQDFLEELNRLADSTTRKHPAKEP